MLNARVPGCYDPDRGKISRSAENLVTGFAPAVLERHFV
jgi:hypothetical protein